MGENIGTKKVLHGARLTGWELHLGNAHMEPTHVIVCMLFLTTCRTTSQPLKRCSAVVWPVSASGPASSPSMSSRAGYRHYFDDDLFVIVIVIFCGFCAAVFECSELMCI